MAALVGEGPQYFEYKVEGLNQTAFFDISEAACQPFGFYHGYRVSTPRGGATVIGVKDGSLWVHVDHEQGATILPGNYEQLLGLGVTQIEEAPSVYVAEKAGDYHVKRVCQLGRKTHIVLQNENGPCPLLALCNALLLRGDATITPKEGVSLIITNAELSNLVTNRMLNVASQMATPDAVEQAVIRASVISDEIKRLEVGLDVNVGFKSVDDFEGGGLVDAFSLSQVRLLHGWLPAVGFVTELIAGRRYNELVSAIVSEEEAVKLMPVRMFLQDAGNQLTNTGIELLRKAIAEHEIAVLFRNNHFATITKHADMLYSLVTDVGYERERNIVWELLGDTRQSRSEFFSGDFVSTESSKRQEALDTLQLMGYSRESAAQAVAAVSSGVGKLVDEESVSNALAWLSSKGVPRSFVD